jgi:hypothetical protein
VSRRNLLSISILAFIGGIFVLKYVSRYSCYAGLLSLLYFAWYFAVFFFVAGKFRVSEGLNTNVYRSFLGVLIVASVAAVHYFPEASRVARLPAIKSWLNYLFSGKFPYDSPAAPSGFPFLFFLAMPFYLAGNLGYIEVLGIVILFGYILLRYPGTTLGDIWLRSLLFLFLPTIYYEFLVRSELLFNMTLVIALIVFTWARVSPFKRDAFFFLTAILYGLVLSTRSVVLVPYSIFLIFLFRTNIINGLVFLGVMCVPFLLTLVPFALWDMNAFLARGPFTIQAGHFPLLGSIMFFWLAAFAGLKAKDIRDVMFSSGIMLFAIVAAKFVLTIRSYDLYKAVFMDQMDIAYFIFCIPFLILSVQLENRGRANNFLMR